MLWEEKGESGKKLRLLLVPLIFIVLLHVPAMILAIVPGAYLLGGGIGLGNPFVLIFGISMLIWWVLFLHIPLGVYIALLVAYTVVSWTWVLRRKRGNAKYFIVWIVLCVLSILMYWKWGVIYHSMMYM